MLDRAISPFLRAGHHSIPSLLCRRKFTPIGQSQLTENNPGLTYIGTDPQHERRGAASLLLQWGLERCTHEHTPAYLESTFDAGPLYERHGFTPAENISMVLEGRSEAGESVLYEEVCFVFRPRPSAVCLAVGHA